MRAFTAPLVLAVLGTLIMAATTHRFTHQGRSKGADQPFLGRALLVLPLVLAAYALFGVLKSIWSGHDNWWAWLAALAVQLLAVYHGHGARERYVEATALDRLAAPPGEQRTRSQFTCLFFGLAFGSLLVVALVLPNGGAGAAMWRVVTSALLFAVSMVTLCAATWSSAGVFRVRTRPRGR